jgi:AraC-like DNA-binding protein
LTLGDIHVLAQTQHRVAPGHAAFFERRTFRSSHVRVIALRSSRLVTDFELLERAAPFMTHCRRSQVTLVLEGRAYLLDESGCERSLAPGDVLFSDQLRGEPESFGGERSSVVIVEWDDDSLAPPWRRPAERARLSASELDLARTALENADGRAIVETLIALLRGLGVGVARDVRPALRLEAPARVYEIVRLVDASLSALDRHPSLDDVADGLGVTRRQASRWLSEYTREHTPHAAGYRDLLHASQLEAAIQFLSLPDRPPIEHVASMAGYRSPVALCHAFSRRGLPTPRAIAERLATRWR